MLGFFKNKSKGKVICSPCNGRVVPITEVPDPTFSEKILGDGVAVIPSEGRFYAPADGEVTAVFDTLHAFTMTTTQGVELLLHIGLDTVILKGAPFKSHISVGDQVKNDQPLAIVEAMKLMNEIESDFDGKVAEIYVQNGQAVEYGQPLFRIV